MSPKRSLTLLDIVLLNIVAVASLRWIASAASIGPSSLVLWVLAALLFFVPEGLAVARLSRRFPEEGGLYKWTGRALGDNHAFLCGWCYWVNTLLFFPSLLLYVAANLAFALQAMRPEWNLGSDKTFVSIVTLGTLWTIAGLTLIGMRAGKWVQNGGSIGNWIPGIAVTVLGFVALAVYGSANPINFSTLVPKFDDYGQLSFFAQMCFALSGLELVSFLGGDVKDPERTIGRAIWVSAIAILGIYMLGTLGILLAVPQEKVTIVNGLLLPVQEMGTRWALPWLAGVCAFFIAVGGIGGTMAWFAGASRVPYIVGVDRYLPQAFGRLHPKLGTPYVAILVQAGVSTVFTLIATAGVSTKLETAYKILVDMCLILYFIPFCYLFLSWFRLRETRSEAVLAIVGLATTVVAIVTTVFPSGAALDPVSFYKTLFGTLAMLGLGIALYVHGRVNKTSLAPVA